MTTLYDSQGRDIYDEREKVLQKTLGRSYLLLLYLERTPVYTAQHVGEVMACRLHWSPLAIKTRREAPRPVRFFLVAFKPGLAEDFIENNEQLDICCGGKKKVMVKL